MTQQNKKACISINYTYLASSFINNYNIMQEGTVKFFNETKGFGFITPNEGREDIFVHSTGLIDRIKENDKVQFETERGTKGINAINVKTLN